MMLAQMDEPRSSRDLVAMRVILFVFACLAATWFSRPYFSSARAASDDFHSPHIDPNDVLYADVIWLLVWEDDTTSVSTSRVAFKRPPGKLAKCVWVRILVEDRE